MKITITCLSFQNILSWFRLSEWLLLLDWSNYYKGLRSSSRSWLIITKYPLSIWQWISTLLCRFISVLYHQQNFFWTIGVIGRVPYKKNEQFTLPEYLGLPHFYWVCVVVFLVYDFWLVHNVARVLGLSIQECTFGFFCLFNASWKRAIFKFYLGTKTLYYWLKSL